MHKKIAIYLPLSLFVLILIAAIFSKKDSPSFKTPINQIEQARKSEFTHTVIFPNSEISVILADTMESREVGLGGRKSIGKNQGMLFDFGYENTYPFFWMKDMEFPLDIIWLDDDVVVDITPDVPVPEPDTPDNKLEQYRSSKPIDKVIEVNAGYVKTNNIKIGDKVIISRK